MNRRAAVVLVVVFGGFFVLFLLFLAIAYSAVRNTPERHAGKTSFGGPKIGVVELKGTIGDEKGGIQGSREAEQIRDFAEDDKIKAILIRIDSPGGSVAPSQEIWEEIKRSRKKKKVVCSQGNLAASGGYYISVACDEIVANPGTLTGSIGVISQFLDAKELLALAKVQQTTLKTGALKDSGSPFREFNAEDRKYFDGLLHEIFEQFLSAVAEGRHKTVEEIRPLADGRVFSGAQAKALGLVDALGNFRTAVDRVMELAGLHGEPELVYPEKKEAFPFLDVLRGGAHAVGQEFVKGAVDGVTDRVSMQGGILFLAPGLTGGLR
jgi:protease-4